MSLASVRQAIVDTFQAPAVTGLNKVYSGSIPRIDNPNEWIVPGNNSAAFGVATIESRHEHRKAVGLAQAAGGPGAEKRLVYQCALLIICRSMEPDPQDAVAFHDQLVQDCVNQLQANPTLGDAVFSAGEGADLGLDDIEVQFDMPKVSKQMLEIWCAMRFVVVEWALV